VERCKRAIHLRTGDRGTDGAIAAWLERHGVDVIACADAFEACTFALTHSAATPDLALVGADWLPPDQLAIIGYLRETWPGVTTVVYGSAPATAGFEATPLTLVQRSAAAVQRMLAGTPGALLEESLKALRAQAPLDDGWRPQAKTPPPAEPQLPAAGTALPRPASQTRDAHAPGGELTPRVTGQDSETGGGARPPVRQTILTQEELAALLEDDKK
jgi:hypothetical protein